MFFRVTDFGMTTRDQTPNNTQRRISASADAQNLKTAACGTPPWMAPEISQVQLEIHDKMLSSGVDDRALEDQVASAVYFQDTHKVTALC